MTAGQGGSASEAETVDVIVIGAGVTGLYALNRLRARGFSVRVFEQGAGVGGTWYWNRYPGARFDSESYTYGYSFSEELLREWEWSEHYAGQPEAERYLNYVADRFDLRRDIRLQTQVTAAVWNDRARRWTGELEDGTVARGQFLIPAVGWFSAQYVPEFEGLDTFQGAWCHTGRWPADGIDLAGKQVGVIGTGATGTQLIAAIAPVVGRLTVFQRTPNYGVPLRNASIDPETQLEIKARVREILDACSDTETGFAHVCDPRPALSLSEEERLLQYERLWGEAGFKKFLANFQEVMTPGPVNEEYSAFVRQKICGRIHDPTVAKMLVPTDHPFGGKRVPCESGYYEVFNEDNVELVDVRRDRIERISPCGVVTSSHEYPLDVIVFATGYDAITGALTRIDIRGESGQTLKTKFQRGVPTYMGMQTVGFPNLFTVNVGGRGNYVRGMEPIVDWVTDCITYLRDRGFTRIEPTEDAEARWTQHVVEVAATRLIGQGDSWHVGTNIPGKARFYLGSPDSAAGARAMRKAVAESGYEGFLLMR